MQRANHPGSLTRNEWLHGSRVLHSAFSQLKLGTRVSRVSVVPVMQLAYARCAPGHRSGGRHKLARRTNRLASRWAASMALPMSEPCTRSSPAEGRQGAGPRHLSRVGAHRSMVAIASSGRSISPRRSAALARTLAVVIERIAARAQLMMTELANEASAMVASAGVFCDVACGARS